MSEQPKQYNTFSTFLFMLFLCVICALLLSMVAASLRPKQEQARMIDRNRQMLISAMIMDHSGHFLMKNAQGDLVPAKADAGGILVPGSITDLATDEEIQAVYDLRITPLLTNAKGEVTSFEKAGINMEEYIKKNSKSGYHLPAWKLLYIIKPNRRDTQNSTNMDAEGYIIPVNGFGLWSAIYGYIAVGSDANTVIGTTWYQQEETAGLGAEIATESFQKEFVGKKIFLEGSSQKTDFATAPLGIIIVKGKMTDQYAKSPKAKSSVDGISGATLTGNGVTAAYATCLESYRQFLIKMHNANQSNQKDS